jgi:hypothetical protein
MPSSLMEMVFLGAALGAAIISPSDFLGLLRPEKWREFGDKYPEAPHIKAVEYLFL